MALRLILTVRKVFESLKDIGESTEKLKSFKTDAKMTIASPFEFYT